jgi:sterol desaturase/sphingolipid hydroxylase (fatty acid hydroxylase superfamily)
MPTFARLAIPALILLAMVAVRSLGARRGRSLSPGGLFAFLLAVVAFNVAQKDWTLAAVFVAFLAAEGLVPREGKPFWADETRVNLSHSLIKRPAVVAVMATALWLTRGHLSAAPWGMSSRAVPIFVQVLVFLLVKDLKQYGIHRLQHRVGLWWSFHKLHHSSRTMNWLATDRTHVLDLALTQAATNLVLVWLLGVDLRAFAIVAAFSIPIGYLQHANLDIPSLRACVATGRVPFWAYIVNTPNVHALHHAVTARSEATTFNYGETLMVWDLLFGTFRAPDAAHAPFGIDEPTFPHASVASQLVYPFRGRAREGYFAPGQDEPVG